MFRRLDAVLVDGLAQPCADRIASHVGRGPHGQAWTLRRLQRWIAMPSWAWMTAESAWDGLADPVNAAFVLAGSLVLWRWVTDHRRPWATRLRLDARAEAGLDDVWGRGTRGSRVDGYEFRRLTFAFLALIGMPGVSMVAMLGMRWHEVGFGLFLFAKVVDLAVRYLHACLPRPPGQVTDHRRTPASALGAGA